MGDVIKIEYDHGSGITYHTMLIGKRNRFLKYNENIDYDITMRFERESGDYSIFNGVLTEHNYVIRYTSITSKSKNHKLAQMVGGEVRVGKEKVVFKKEVFDMEARKYTPPEQIDNEVYDIISVILVRLIGCGSDDLYKENNK